MDTTSSFYNGTSFATIDPTVFCSPNLPALSHFAAKHKMAIRPINRKAPSRQCRNDILSKVSNTFKSTLPLYPIILLVFCI